MKLGTKPITRCDEMIIEGVKTFTEIGKQLDKWEWELETFENTGHITYFVMEGDYTIATCRRREDAERIVADHNQV